MHLPKLAREAGRGGQALGEARRSSTAQQDLYVPANELFCPIFGVQNEYFLLQQLRMGWCRQGVEEVLNYSKFERDEPSSRGFCRAHQTLSDIQLKISTALDNTQKHKPKVPFNLLAISFRQCIVPCRRPTSDNS